MVRKKTHLIPAAFDVLDAVEALAREKGCSTAQLALAWCGQQPGITSPIVGPRTMKQLDDCLGALSVKLAPDDIARLSRSNFHVSGAASATI